MTVNLEALRQTVDGALEGLHGATAQSPDHELGLDDALTLPGRVGAFAGSVGAMLALPTELANAGIASVTSSVSAMLPAFPAATLGSLYVGVPHAHPHPPSFGLPLPSMGAIMFGTCFQVLIGGVPAARAGDLGLAPTCGGFVPFFEVATGSSKVFIGGTRAARQIDFCKACTPSLTPTTRTASASMRAARKAQEIAQVGALVSGVLADAVDAVTAQGAVASASALSLTMMAAQTAADAAAAAMTIAMGKDPAVPPGAPGALTSGAGNVQIAGVPMPNVPDLASELFKGVAKKKKKKPKKQSVLKRLRRALGGCQGCRK